MGQCHQAKCWWYPYHQLLFSCFLYDTLPSFALGMGIAQCLLIRLKEEQMCTLIVEPPLIANKRNCRFCSCFEHKFAGWRLPWSVWRWLLDDLLAERLIGRAFPSARSDRMHRQVLTKIHFILDYRLLKSSLVLSILKFTVWSNIKRCSFL